jgi:hypothetical protein
MGRSWLGKGRAPSTRRIYPIRAESYPILSATYAIRAISIASK